MITCALKGPGNPGGKPNFGLGNQLFQIATLLSLAKDNLSEVAFPQVADEEFGNYQSTIFRKLNTNLDGTTFRQVYRQPDFYYTPLQFYDNCIYEGYFQSEKFFVHNKSYILDKLSFPKHMLDYVQTKYDNISWDSTVSVHVRRGDYISLQNLHPLQGDEYYNKAIGLYPADTSFVIFSDDISWCKDNMDIPNSVFTDGESDITDMLLMSMCSGNIIANSTFSWWGAWFNRNEDKMVVAPKNWFGPDKGLSDKDLVPESWIKI